jgi:hypothetical protein
MTPTENAYTIALNALAAAHKYEMRYSDETKGDKAKIKAIAKLHNKLLDKSGMDGVPLEVKP